MRLKMDLLVCSNDFPAGAVLMYGMGSTSAFKYCKACDADTRVGDPTKPFSFLRRLMHPDLDTGWNLRSLRSVQVCRRSMHVQHLCSCVRALMCCLYAQDGVARASQAPTKAKRARILQDEGLSMPEFPYYPIMERLQPRHRMCGCCSREQCTAPPRSPMG